MRAKQLWLALVAMGFNACLSCAAHAEQPVQTYPDWVTNGPDAQEFVLGREGKYIWNTNPARFWRGIWREDTNGWRVRLNVPTNTADIMTVDVGSVVKNSGGGYMRTPNGKFASFELTDSSGHTVQPRPAAGTNLLDVLGGIKATWPPNPPAWAAPTDGMLAEQFPQTISLSAYPRDRVGGPLGAIFMNKNDAPQCINRLKINDWYVITNAGDYTLTVRPVLYKLRLQGYTNTGVLDRVDLPCVTAKAHLVPGGEPTKSPYR